MERNEIAVAFDILLEEIENAIGNLNQEGANVLQKGNYDDARDLIEKGCEMAIFRNKVKELQKEWGNFFSGITVRLRKRPKRELGISQRKFKERLKYGLRTQEDDFRVPILQVLEKMGGSAAAAEVLEKVGNLMKPSLNKYDLSFLPSNPNEPRWRKTANWARMIMVKEGLLSPNSPRGVWEVTEAGRRWLVAATK